MEPFYFGEKNRRLLGIYHAPTGPSKDRGFLLCPPILGEYMRTHSCLRELAIQLANYGYPVLRFDYFGTGDSDGDISDASVAVWQDNIRASAAELRAISGVRRSTAFGVRFGASLAVTALQQCRDIDGLFLWDPILSGKDYLASLKRTHKYLIASHEDLSPKEVALAEDCFTGYDLRDELIQDIAAIDLASLGVTTTGSTITMTTSKPEYEAANRHDFLRGGFLVETDCNWGMFSETVIFARSIVPEILKRIES